ncbi:zinc ABC transporter substrate-binding protein [Nocardioides sp. zg-579]|uniref:Zinc ABC transporter substrate-binding protein n=1 Tax=Nocardioides marmotae TaxID=2663857 RepID=A0A6I3JH01_9ACTN|nr:metal ABC transporter substrate-binding protein [Nocardioides marmotae]MCR6033540.1 zinc ABC transporter substrate-binding protein [Gordonia jinghuaiqii]MTB97198.1 zinc ABC transporter substrate-binding protein [Nocardioides marmotae]QKE02115.1 zinc ABC transporter substrate-binding protein [Nocardioides marmotae]
MSSRRLRRRTAPAVCAVAALALSGCAALTGEEESGGSAEGSRTIVAGLYPLAYVAERVAGDAFEVENLTSPGSEPHDLELGLSETAEVSDAALLLYLDSLQPAVDAAAEENAGGEVLDAASVVDLLPFEDEHDHADEGGDEHAGGDHADHDHDHEGHDHGDLDPHFWQDPVRMADLGDAVAERLAEIDPEEAETFRANAADLRADLEALDEEYAAGLADCARNTVVTSHDAFGYLEKYGLDMHAIAGISPDAEPSPAALAELQELIREDGVTTVFSESLASPKTAEVLADDAGVRTAVLDTAEGLTDETADEDYLSLMRANLAALQEANGC